MSQEKDSVVDADRSSLEKRSHTSQHDEDLVYTDSVHAGLRGPTEEEKLMLRRVPDALPWSTYCASYQSLIQVSDHSDWNDSTSGGYSGAR